MKPPPSSSPVPPVLRAVLLAFLAPLCGHSQAAAGAAVPASAPLNITVTPTQEGVTPAVLGYNASHFLPGTNAPDWWRYTGAKAARVLRGPSTTDVVHPHADMAAAKAGEGIDSFAKFMQRRAALRANAENPDQPLDNSFIDWPWFKTRFENTLQAVSGQRFYTTPMFTELRRQGVDILVQMSAGGSGFEIADDNDWAAKWLVWRYYYTHAFLMSRDFDVVRYSMYNEPNIGDTPTYEQWHRLLLIASDAIQGAIADVNTRHGKNLKPEIFAPHCTSPYDWEPHYPSPNSPVSPNIWAENAVNDRHKRFDGTTDPNWRNFHFFNHQRYLNALTPNVAYADLINGIRNLIKPLTDAAGEAPYDIGLTEFNTTDIATSRRNTETADQPKHYSSFGGTLVALTRADARQLYLFLFGQTIQKIDGIDNPVYPVRKNGTHYVSDATGGYNYGGATQIAEVYRLFLKAAQGARPHFACTVAPAAAADDDAAADDGGDGDSDPLPDDLYLLVTRDADAGALHIFAANRATEERSLNLDLSAFGLPEGNLFTVEEVSDRSNGGVVAHGTVATVATVATVGAVGAGAAAGIGTLTLRPQSVVLVSIPTRPQAAMPGGTTTLVVPAIADTQLADGAAKDTPGGGGAVMVARSDGLTADGRRVALLKFRVPAIAPADMQVVLLDLFAAATGGTARIQAHVYGLDDDWDEATVTFASLTTALRQNVPAGNKIANNVVNNQEGGPASILGQLLATSDTLAGTLVNVTDFVRRQDDGYASFLIAQDHRMEWTLDPDIAPEWPNEPNHIPGDTQWGGIRIVTREGAENAGAGAAYAPRLLIAASSAPSGPALIAQPAGAVADEGAPVTLSVTTLEIGADVTYQWRKDGVPLTDTTPGVAGAATATLTLAGALADAGFYDCIVTNQTGSTTSDAVIIVIHPAAATTGNFPDTARAIAVDRDNNLYIADAAQHTIHVITPDNRASLFAGVSGSYGRLDGAGAAALFNAPGALAVRDGNLYVADTGNSTIRAVSAAGRVTTLAGAAGTHNHADGRGAAARFDRPEGIAAATAGAGDDTVLYIADTGNHVIRKISPNPLSFSGSAGTAGPLVTTLAGKPKTAGALNGTGTDALFHSPTGIAATGTGAGTVLYVADTGNHAIRKINAATGEVTTLAGVLEQEGGADATGTAARFRSPRGLLVDGAGEIYVADTGNSTIRLIAGGTVTTIAGLPGTDAEPGLAGFKDGKGEYAWFDHPAALALAENGNLYIADTGNRALRVIDENDNVSTLPVTAVTAGNGGGNTGGGGTGGSAGGSPQNGGGGAPSPLLLPAIVLLAIGRFLRDRRRRTGLRPVPNTAKSPKTFSVSEHRRFFGIGETPVLRTAVTLSISFIIFLPPAPAQQTPAPPAPAAPAVADEIITLSVFEVTDTRDIGYHASTTLAGTGTGEDLKNIPMSVDVLTKEFLEDIGATDIYEASRYALGGEFNPNDGDSSSGPDLRSFSFRGFRTAWQTRDFFIWNLPADGYSYERLDFMRGPNAVLAGDAEPGGVMNINTKRAHWRNRATLGARVGSWGRYRGTLDWNQVVTKNWAIRLNAVYDEKSSWKDWVGDTRKSALLSTTFKLGRMTQLRFSGEYGKLDSHPSFSLPREQYSVWEAAGSPAHTRYSAGGSAIGTNRMGTNASTPGYWYIYDTAANRLRDWNGMGQTNLPSGNNSKPVIDESIYPRDLQLTGPDTYNNREYWTVTAWFEHRFTHNLTFELAYNYQTYTRNGLLPNGITYLHRDPNPLLPDNITPNPHFGDAYADYRWQKSWTKFAGHSYRASLVYDWDRLSWTKQRFHLGIGARSESSDRWTCAEIWDNPIALANHSITSKYLYRRIYISDARDAGALRFDGLINDPDGTGVVSYFAPTVTMDATKTLMSYGQLSASGEYLGGIIRTTLGVRRDYAKNKTHEALIDEVTRIYAYDPASPERTTLDVNNTSVMAGIIYNWWKPLSLTFNYSQSYRPASQPVFLLDGNNPPPRLGAGKEVGIRYSALGDRLSISACLYDITQKNNVITFASFNINPLTQINAIWNDETINALHPGWINNDLPGEDSDRREMESIRGRGFETAVHLNLTREWSFRASYGLADNETSETAALTRAYIERNMPQWEAVAASDPLIAGLIDDRIANLKEFLRTEVPGRKSLRVSRHTANMFTRYAFRNGRLKGLTLGGGLNYRSGVILYYDGDQNPVRGHGGTLVNLMAGYNFKAGRAQWRVTLNMNNALNHITLNRRSAAASSYADPRSWSLNTSVTF